MKPQLQLIRAIGCEFAVRKLRPLTIITAIVSIVIIAVGIWLTTLSAWWWLLLAPILLITVVATIAFIVAWLFIAFLRPTLSKPQSVAVINFVNKLERVANTFQTPLPLILFRIIKDVARPKPDNYIKTIATDSSTLHGDFASLQQNFDKS